MKRFACARLHYYLLLLNQKHAKFHGSEIHLRPHHARADRGFSCRYAVICCQPDPLITSPLKRLILLILPVLFTLSLTAQVPLTIKGTVTSEGKPLEGVTVGVSSSLTKTKTDAAGSFSIQVKNESDILEFSYVGYKTEMRVAGKQQNISVELMANPSELDNVVIIGYGQVKRRDVTGAVGKVNIKDLQKAPVRSFEEALGGRIAGVQVTSADGQPGSGVSIVIRGQNSITQSNAPLFVIDGFPIEDPDNNLLNPDEIESIEILKDASATAIYGARGANGVIIITTKKGKEGTPVISYSGSAGEQQIIKKMEMMDPYEFVRYMLERQPTTSAGLYLTNGRKLEDYKNIPGTYWQDELFRTAFMQNHSLSLRGGSKNTKYSVSGSFLGQDGLIVSSGYKRGQGRFTLDQTINKNLKAGINVNYTYARRFGNSPSPLESAQFSDGLMYSILAYRPVTGNENVDLINDEYDEDIDIANNGRWNPKLTANNEIRDNFSRLLIANAYAEQAIGEHFKLRISGGIIERNTKSEEFNNSKTYYGSVKSLVGKQRGVNGSVVNGNVSTWLNENTLSYDQSFNDKHRINTVVGATFQQINTTLDGMQAYFVPRESLGISGLEEGTPNRLYSSSSSNTQVSFLGRVNYTLNDKYLLTFSMRADGSSKFAPKNKWSYFPSGAIAWKIQNEQFMEALDFISTAKLRASYGVTGNNRVPDFAYQSVIDLPYANLYPFNNTLTTSAIPSELGNADLKWETTHQVDAGLELGFFKDRFLLEVDYYRKDTRDLLLNASMPTSSGYQTAYKNIGRVKNHGVELTASAQITSGKFKWNSSFNISFNRNEIVELTRNQESLLTAVNLGVNYRTLPLYIARVGSPIAQFYGYVWEGNFQYRDFDITSTGTYVLKPTIASNGSDRNAVQPGDIKYKDMNGDGLLDANDYTAIGNPNPDFFGGFSNNFSYANFDLSVFLQFSYGNEVFNANRLVFEGWGSPQQNMFASYVNRWSPENQTDEHFRTNGQGPYAYSSKVVEDASFLRLKTVSLGYNISGKYLKRAKLQSCRLYVSAQNLITWTSYQGFDPEVSARNSTLTPNFDYAVYPRAKTLMFGLNLTF
jgi:TonB-linked SusC/RagA family outer membrane protein